MKKNTIVAAIDAGGTSFKCGLVRADGQVQHTFQIPTGSPDDTLAACIGGFKSAFSDMDRLPAGLGLACFGPVDIDPNSAHFGVIRGAAKPDWQDTAIGPRLAEALGLPVALDTDVNAALAAEQRWGAAQGIDRAAYMTVGTGIGVGVATGDVFLGRPTHPEFGHIRVARHPTDDVFPGVCALHGTCLEGLASANAVTARWGDPAMLATDHPAWEVEAHYLGQACLNLYLTTRVDRILIGGGLLKAQSILPKTRSEFDALMSGYLPVSGQHLLQAPQLGEQAGMLGGAVLALTRFN